MIRKVAPTKISRYTVLDTHYPYNRGAKINVVIQDDFTHYIFTAVWKIFLKNFLEAHSCAKLNSQNISYNK